MILAESSNTRSSDFNIPRKSADHKGMRVTQANYHLTHVTPQKVRTSLDINKKTH